MEKQNYNTNNIETNKTGSGQSNQANSENGMKSSRLMVLFEDELMEILWVEKELIRSIPKLIEIASSKKLISILEKHLEETKEQVQRVESVFATLSKTPIAEKCKPMEAFIKEAEEIIDDCERGEVCDAGIISVVRKIEHYEIASYSTLRQFAETLGLHDAIGLLQSSLDEEKAADEKLSEVSISNSNGQSDHDGL